ncbi:MAG: glycosyltransferase, partial [Candidatus Pacebacteria bacterium]|nr:glycosyltransferase [Candidatus Paceibacterota bacterium]
MKIAIDVRCLTDGRRTGVEEYTLSLLENIFEIDRKNKYVLFLNAWKEPRFDFSTLEKYPNVKLKRLRIPNKLLNFSFWYQDWPKINRLVGGADIVFSPNIIFGAVSKYVKHVTTIHDLSFERYPEYFSQKRRWWHIFINARKICRQANRIIAVSESTKKDVV